MHYNDIHCVNVLPTFQCSYFVLIEEEANLAEELIDVFVGVPHH